MPYAFACKCRTHDKEGHTCEKCDFQLKKIIFLNPEGWRAYEFIGGQKVKLFYASELNEEGTGAWQKLVLEIYKEWHWIREDDFVIPAD